MTSRFIFKCLFGAAIKTHVRVVFLCLILLPFLLPPVEHHIFTLAQPGPGHPILAQPSSNL